MSDLPYQKQIRILDEELDAFQALWNVFEQHETTKPFQPLEDFIEMLSLQYGFDRENFTLYTKEGKLFHRRVPRFRPVEKLE